MKPFLPLLVLLAALPTRAAEPAPVRAVKTDKTVDFYVGDELVTRYHYGPDVAKPYFWPLNAPGGVPVTRAWPMDKGAPNQTTDHVHQKSAWFCHGDVIPEGLDLKVRSADKHVKGVDFWSEGRGHGTIKCVSVGDPRQSNHQATVQTRNEWLTADGTKILDEDRMITVRDLGDARLVVLDIDLHASVCPIVFGDTKEGSMGVRVSDSFRLNAPGSEGVITAAEGATAKAPAKDNLPMWGKRSDWHDYSGTVGGKRVGLAIFDDPRNAHRAAWHTRAYGLMAANPFGRAGSQFPAVKGQTELVRIPKGGELKLRYGVLVHTGTATDAKVGERYAAFARE